MHRRRFLSAVCLGILGSAAGCTADEGPTGTPSTAPPTTSPPPTAPPTDGSGAASLPIPESDLTRGAPKDGIPAIVDPAFGPDWSGLEIDTLTTFGEPVTIEPRLQADDAVIGVDRADEARAYPLKVLNWHEVVNDTLDGPLLVTYCPLCGSGMTAKRTVDGVATTFGVSGYLYHNDLVMYDERTGSLWSQIMATAINGPKTGARLDLVPSTLTTWDAWRSDHEDTVVLLPPPESNTVVGRDATRNYGLNPYVGYDESARIGIKGDYDDDRLHPKATVLGIAHDGVARAYPLDRVLAAGAINDEVGGLPVVVTVAPGDTLVGYERRVDGEVLRFDRADDRHLAAGGSRWRAASGEAVDGPFEGRQLPRANDVSPLFFFAWQDFHPDTTVFGDG